MGHDDHAGDGPVEVAETGQARRQALGPAIDALSEGLFDGTLDRETVQASLAHVDQIDLDLARARDALHVPEDAGKHAMGARS